MSVEQLLYAGIGVVSGIVALLWSLFAARAAALEKENARLQLENSELKRQQGKLEALQAFLMKCPVAECVFKAVVPPDQSPTL